MVTIFTPTYNRGYIISSLYDSLCNQTIKKFEWLIVDDGSTDNTEELIQNFIAEAKIKIRYYRQRNSGKHVAINNGVMHARGELFFIVDSDDYLEKNAIERLLHYYEQIRDNNNFVGVSGTRISFSGKRIGGEFQYRTLDCSPIALRMTYKISGDMAEAFKTEVLKKYPFPVFDGEKFCPEALIWNRLSLKYCIRYFNEGIYKCEYRSDGLTAKIIKLRMHSPLSSRLYYSELYKMKIPIMQKIKAAINFWRFACCSKLKFSDACKQISCFTLLFFPISFIYHIVDLRK